MGDVQAQGAYERVPLSKVKKGCERPLVIRAADDVYLAVAEARCVDYARMKLRLCPTRPTAWSAI